MLIQVSKIGKVQEDLVVLVLGSCYLLAGGARHGLERGDSLNGELPPSKDGLVCSVLRYLVFF